MRSLFGCPDIVSLTEKFLMARNFFRIFTENNPVMGYSKTFFIPEAKGLSKFDVKFVKVLNKLRNDSVFSFPEWHKHTVTFFKALPEGSFVFAPNVNFSVVNCCFALFTRFTYTHPIHLHVPVTRFTYTYQSPDSPTRTSHPIHLHVPVTRFTYTYQSPDSPTRTSHQWQTGKVITIWLQYKWGRWYITLSHDTTASLNSDDGLDDLTVWWRFTTWLPPCELGPLYVHVPWWLVAESGAELSRNFHRMVVHLDSQKVKRTHQSSLCQHEQCYSFPLNIQHIIDILYGTSCAWFFAGRYEAKQFFLFLQFDCN